MQVRALKRFGQNFLKNPHISQKIVAAIEPGTGDTILEIGPGKGALTRLLLEKNIRRLIAVEIDRRLIEELKKFEKASDTFTLINKDFMKLSFSELSGGSRIKLIGNIPYNLTSGILFKILDNYQYVSRAVLMIQKEVAERIVSGPGSRDYGILSVMTAIHGKTQRVLNVSRENFSPVPRVDSAVIAIDLFEKPLPVEDYHLFKEVVKASFQTRRKKMSNNLKRHFGSELTSYITTIDQNKRPEQLSVDEFRSLANEIYHLRLEGIE